jgi:hypothetical protein
MTGTQVLKGIPSFMSEHRTVKQVRPDSERGKGADVSDEDRVSGYIYEFIGSAVKELIRSGRTISYEELTLILHRLSEDTGDARIRQRCREFISMLMNKKH